MTTAQLADRLLTDLARLADLDSDELTGVTLYMRNKLDGPCGLNASKAQRVGEAALAAIKAVRS